VGYSMFLMKKKNYEDFILQILFNLETFL